MPRLRRRPGEVCRQKRQFHTRAAALRVVHTLIEQGAAEGSMNAYRCPRCGAWHVGHRRLTQGRHR